MKKLIVIADWVEDSLRCQELRIIVEGYLNNPAHPSISFVGSSHSSIHAGFLADQLAAVEERFGRPLETVIFVDLPSQTSELFIARLKTGLHVVGSNKGNVFSLVKNNIDAVFHYPGLGKDATFRKRDSFYRIIAHLLESKQDDLELEEVHNGLIPELQDYVIGHVDSYGNIKTSIPESSVKETYDYDDLISITINGITKKAKYKASLSESEKNELVLYPGSSGPLKDYYMDIAIYSDFEGDPEATAIAEFNMPETGMSVSIADIS